MKTDFRALCAELADAYLRTLEHINNSTWLGYEPSDDPLLQRARASLADEPPEPAPPADGEVAELGAALRTDAECVAAEQPDLMQLTDKQLTRAADLLECLEQVAYAASDFICGTRFPEFANEHGGIDRLMADLCRLVAQFEHGPRPVPGVDVPGPDGDWGGLAELCNAEGVDLRIGVPLLQRAREAWKYASQAAPVPAEGEVAELVEWLQEEADDYECIGCEDSAAKCERAAELLQRLASPACVVLKPSPELIEAFQDALPGRIEPLLEERHPAPVPVGERLPEPEVGE